MKILATREHFPMSRIGSCPERADHARSERDEHRGTPRMLRDTSGASRSPARGRVRPARRSRRAVPGARRARTWGFFRVVSAGIDIENGGVGSPARSRRKRARTTFPDSDAAGARRRTLSNSPVPLRDARVSASEAPRTHRPDRPDPIANNASTDHKPRSVSRKPRLFLFRALKTPGRAFFSRRSRKRNDAPLTTSSHTTVLFYTHRLPWLPPARPPSPPP